MSFRYQKQLFADLKTRQKRQTKTTSEKLFFYGKKIDKDYYLALVFVRNVFIF